MVGTHLRVKTFTPFSVWGIVKDFNQGNGMVGFTRRRRSPAVVSSLDSKSGRLEAEGQGGGHIENNMGRTEFVVQGVERKGRFHRNQKGLLLVWCGVE